MPINPATQDAGAYTALRVGFTVERATALLPQTTATEYFTIAGGRVLALFVGEVTVLIETATTATKLVHSPSTGTDMDMCATLDITADEVGTLYTLTGTAGDAMIGGGQSGPIGQGIILSEGTVDLDCGAGSDGQTKWTCYYIPLDDGATVTAA